MMKQTILGGGGGLSPAPSSPSTNFRGSSHHNDEYLMNPRNMERSLSKSLGERGGGFLFPPRPAPTTSFHRQISEVSSISHSGYLFKRSNRPFQSISPFPIIDSLDIYIGDSGIIAASSGEPVIRFKPIGMITNEGGFDEGAPQTLPVTSTAMSPRVQLFATVDPQLSKIPMVPFLPSSERSVITVLSEDEEASVTVTQGQQQQLSPEEEQKIRIRQSFQLAANFFGVGYASVNLQQQPRQDTNGKLHTNVLAVNGVTTAVEATTPEALAAASYGITASTSSAATSIYNNTQQQRSAPIKVVNKNQDDSESSFDPAVVHRRMSCPSAMFETSSDASATGNSTSRSRPSDFVEPRDGHLWRAKYCVLEQGILYFYRNADDANSPEAVQERAATDPLQNEGSTPGSGNGELRDLSKSPMASKRCITIPGSLSPSSEVSNFLWEKRVALSCVGAVRSAESEYGKNSFELLAVQDEEEDDGYTDKLVLRSVSSEEMNEWLFQFHRSLASFVMNMVDMHSAQNYSLGGDLHHPRFAMETYSHTMIDEASALRSVHYPTYSPRFGAQILQTPTSLSHGHGRNSLRRRKRVDMKTKSLDEDIVKPATPNSQSPTPMPFPLSNMSSVPSNLVTPLSHGDLHTPPPGEEVQYPPQQQQPTPSEMETTSPELSAPQSDYPETERPPPSKPGKYIPPHLRNSGGGKYVPLHLRNGADTTSAPPPSGKYVPPHLRNNASGGGSGTKLAPRGISLEERESIEGGGRERSFFAKESQESTVSMSDTLPPPNLAFKLGGCADPSASAGSILDEKFIDRKASHVGPVRLEAFGSFGGEGSPPARSESDEPSATTTLRWEIGAASECGIRDSNEDAYFISNNLLEAFKDMKPDGSTRWHTGSDHKPGLFAVFDGHCGNQAARFAAERLSHYIFGASQEDTNHDDCHADAMVRILERALSDLDDSFCRLCVKDDRDWDSGATAIIAMVANEHLVIANIGDCRAVICRSIEEKSAQPSFLQDLGWKELDNSRGTASGRRNFWTAVSEPHNPSREDERTRIEAAGGWTTTEKEIPIGQLGRMDWDDEEVVGILKRCFFDRINSGSTGSRTCSSAPQRILQISRVCGELAVSRAIGDRDFKAAFNMEPSSGTTDWDCPLLLPFPDGHCSRKFVGDLVSGKPDFHSMKVGAGDVKGEFLLMACDGLWDVMDPDDAVRVTHELLFEKGCTAKQAAARLAELAIHLGSSDNITVIVCRFFPKDSL